MSDSENNPTPPQRQTGDSGGRKDPNTLVYCELPNRGGTIITTLAHCIGDLNGTPKGKTNPPPPTTVLVTCVSSLGTVSTTEADCTGVLQGTVQTVTPPDA